MRRGPAVLVAIAIAGCTSGSDGDVAGTAASEGTATPGAQASAPATAAGTPSSTPAAPTTATPNRTPRPLATPVLEEFELPDGSRPHDVAPAADGVRAWYVAQRLGDLGLLDPRTGDVETVALGDGSAPHGVIVGPDGDPWITDGGRNSVIRVDAEDRSITEYPVPGDDANLNTAAFDADGRLWFTGQGGIYGSVDPTSGEVRVHAAPRGSGPYGMTATPDGTVWFASLAGGYIARIEDSDGTITTFDVPTDGGGARRVWADSGGRLWVTEWFAGRLARFDPGTGTWDEWDVPGDDPRPYAVYVDDRDQVWVTDFGADALVRFDPGTEQFTTFAFPTPGAEIRQLLGRPGEVWGVGSALDTAIVMRTAG